MLTEPPKDVRPKALVVDDEYLIARDVAEAMREVGFDVIGQSGRLDEALRIAFAERPSLVVTDLNLGEGDEGHRLVEELGSMEGIDFIIFSGDDPACDRFAVHYEDWPILRKPVRVDALQEAAIALMSPTGSEGVRSRPARSQGSVREKR